MKKLILTGKEITLLEKMIEAGYGFWEMVNDFLEKNKITPDESIASVGLEDCEFDDISLVIKKYLTDNNLSPLEKPDDMERIELNALLEKLAKVEN